MKKRLFIFLILMIVSAGCKKKEQTSYETPGGAGVQTLQDAGRLESQFKEALAKDPKNLDAIVSLANLYYDSGQAEKAIEMYKRALEINPKDADIRTDMGTMYRYAGNFDKAIEEFRKAAADDAGHEQSRFNLAVTLFNDKKDLKGASEALEDLLKINPRHSNGLELKRVIDQEMGLQAAKPASPSSGWVNKQ